MRATGGGVGRSLHAMWVGTFHGLAHRFLRAHWRDAGLVEQFLILDSDDQQRMIKRIVAIYNSMTQSLSLAWLPGL